MNEHKTNPQGLVRMLLPAMEEVLGGEELRSVLMAADEACKGLGGAHSPSYISLIDPQEDAGDLIHTGALSGILGSLEQVYGSQAGRGLALRIGRACFQYGLRDHGAGLGITDTSFRLLPLPARLTKFAGVLAHYLGGDSHPAVRFERADGKLLWHMERCPICQERHADLPVCQLAVGLAEESLYWLSGGKIFSVEEIRCVARGDPTCTLQINETPIS